MCRSIADQLCGDQDEHAKYRRDVIEFMRENPDEFSPFVVDSTFEQVSPGLCLSFAYCVDRYQQALQLGRQRQTHSDIKVGTDADANAGCRDASRRRRKASLEVTLCPGLHLLIRCYHPIDHRPQCSCSLLHLQYLNKMSRDAVWGGNLELVGASRCYSVHITIHQLNAPRLDIRHPVAACKTIHVSYHDNEHYSSVRQLNDNSSDPTELKARALIS